MRLLKKCVMAVVNFIKGIIAWIEYQEFKPAKEIVGLFLALCCAAVLFFLPSYDPGYTMTAEKYQELCEKNGFEMQDVTDSYFYVYSVIEDTQDEYTLKYYSCTKSCFARFYHIQEVQTLREQGGFERNVYNSQFQLTTFTDTNHTATVYRNDGELLVVSGPKADQKTLEKILKKCRIPHV